MIRKAIALAAISLTWSAAFGQQTAMLPVTADVGITSVRDKTLFSNGMGPTSPIRQNQNWGGFESKTLVMAFDAKAVRGWTVERAWLHLYLAKGDLYGVGLCTVLAPWQEGSATNWINAAGSPSWDYARNPVTGDQARGRPRRGEATSPADLAGVEWAWPGSKFFSVAWAHPAARFSHAGYGQIERRLEGMNLKSAATQPFTAAIDPDVIQRQQTPDRRFLHLRLPVEPELAESLAAGVAYGLVLTDDKGQVAESYSLIGPAYPYVDNDAEDIWAFTRDISEPGLRPRLEVLGAAKDNTPPGAPAGLKVAAVSPSEQTVWLEFVAPGDDGKTGDLLAYDAACAAEAVSESNWDQATPLPRWSIPKPVAAGKVQRFCVFTLAPGNYHVAVRGVDEAGNRGPVADLALTIPPKPDATLAKGSLARPPGNRISSGKDEPTVAVVPDLVKVDPVSGGILTDGPGYQQDPKYLRDNPVWMGDLQQVYLRAAANEVVACQIVVQKTDKDLTNVKVAVSELSGKDGRKIASENAQAYRLWYVASGGRGQAQGWCGEVCLPLKAPFEESFSLPAADNKVPGQTNQSVWVDLYVPPGTPPGWYSGKVTVSADGFARPATLTLQLEVLPLSLPQANSWMVEMNGYHSPVGFVGVNWTAEPQKGREALWSIYALAHQHRLELNCLPYSHSARVDQDYIPKLQGTGASVSVADWSEWDQRFGPLLDGSAFSPQKGYVGPGAGVPLGQMYLAFHEGWPLPVKGFYEDYKEVSERIGFAEYAKTARRIEQAFKQEYQDGHAAVVRQFVEHFKEKNWTRTHLQFFYNNKYYWKVAYFGGMGTGGVSFWLGDESSDFDDYDYNRFLWSLARRGVQAANAPEVKVHYRADISQPEMARTLWDGLCNLWFTGGLGRFAATAAVRQKFIETETCWQYGGGAGVEAPPVAMMQQFLATWAMNTNGIMPYWTTLNGSGDAWRRANPMAVFYSGVNYAGGGKSLPLPIASVRMKIMRRCQQDIEYLHLLAGTAGWDRPRARRALLPLSDQPDSPVLSFSRLSSQQWLQLRQDLMATLAGGKK